MILVDSSVWIDHLRRSDTALSDLLTGGQVMSHPFIIGELAMGSLSQRAVILSALRDLPQAVVADEEEVLGFIDRHRLFGLGVGYVDAHLMASTRLTAGALLWTRDKRLHDVAKRLKLSSMQNH
jgi:predicted nucleic acid-binding protein